MEDLIAIDARIPASNVFDKLVALELENFTAASLEFLANIDGLQVRYLRLGCHVYNSEAERMYNEERSRNALHQLLPRLRNLEMLRTSKETGATSKTIQLMTDLKLNINWAVICQAYVPIEYDEEYEGGIPPAEIDPFQPGVVDAFRRMLLVKIPGIDLSEIRLVLREGKTIEALEAMNTGFTILKMNMSGYRTMPINELYDPKIKGRLGVDS